MPETVVGKDQTAAIEGMVCVLFVASAKCCLVETCAVSTCF